MLYDPKWEVEAPAKKLEPYQEHLLAAAQYIREHGWCQNSLRNHRGNVCVLGAIVYAGVPINSPAMQKLREVIGRKEIAAWNNSMFRTEKQVLAALEKAAQG